MFIGIKSGVYRHTILSLSHDLEHVKAVGCKFIENEHDHYHTVEVVTCHNDEEKEVCELFWNDKTKAVEIR